MADNYLERRMEDLRSGRLTSGAVQRTAAPRKGMLSFAFPSRRVLVVNGTREPYRTIALDFLKNGCKVAVFDPDQATGSNMARDNGVRFYNIDVDDKDAVRDAMQNLAKAWHDVDIVIADSNSAETISCIWAELRSRLPYPNSFGGRMIIVDEESSIPENLRNTLSPYDITMNCINYPRMKKSPGDVTAFETISRLALFFSISENSRLDNLVIPVL